ncbi:uncharacterized protein LOC131678442 [Topomyia yanbarensis]|uniref:uncharacterized protein LOC131678442 n=1 Tax=Topomyia yanbarensis TaxID=2498891 RepID=UPI00273C81D3|nr:uncharacterized protein LOC131678442 [Topomyia yanbarensis]
MFLVRMEQFFLCSTHPMCEKEKFEIIWNTMRHKYRTMLSTKKINSFARLEELCIRIDSNDPELTQKFANAFEQRKNFECDITQPSTSRARSLDRGEHFSCNASAEQNQNLHKPRYTSNPKAERRFTHSNFRNDGEGKMRKFNNEKQWKRNTLNSNAVEQNHVASWKNMSPTKIREFYKTPENTCFNCRRIGHHFSKCFFRRSVFCYVCGLPDFHYEDCPFVIKKHVMENLQEEVSPEIGKPSQKTENQKSVVSGEYKNEKQDRDGHEFRNHYEEINEAIVSLECDNRYFLKLKILGVEIMGLLDSGSNITAMGNQCGNVLEHFGVNKLDQEINLKTASGEKLEIVGFTDVPLTVQNRTKMFPCLIVPKLGSKCILGVDFF